MKCLSCNHFSATTEIYVSLAIHLPEERSVKKQVLVFLQLLQIEQEPHIVAEHKCDKCALKGQIQKKVTSESLSSSLVIMLNRMTGDIYQNKITNKPSLLFEMKQMFLSITLTTSNQ